MTLRFKFILCLFLPQWIHVHGFTQSPKIKHSFESSLLITIKPSDRLKNLPSTNNPGVDYALPIFKRYKYPGAMFAYRITLDLKNHLFVNGSLSTILRYMEPFFNSNQTFYSFPFRLGIEKNILTSKQRVYTLELGGGYNIKHPKYKFYDGIGGITGSINFRQKHLSKSHYLKFGIDYLQERNIMFWKFSQFLAQGIDETIRFNSHLFQASFGFGIVLQKKAI